MWLAFFVSLRTSQIAGAVHNGTCDNTTKSITLRPLSSEVHENPWNQFTTYVHRFALVTCVQIGFSRIQSALGLFTSLHFILQVTNTLEHRIIITWTVIVEGSSRKQFEGYIPILYKDSFNCNIDMIMSCLSMLRPLTLLWQLVAPELDFKPDTIEHLVRPRIHFVIGSQVLGCDRPHWLLWRYHQAALLQINPLS